MGSSNSKSSDKENRDENRDENQDQSSINSLSVLIIFILIVFAIYLIIKKNKSTKIDTNAPINMNPKDTYYTSGLLESDCIIEIRKILNN